MKSLKITAVLLGTGLILAHPGFSAEYNIDTSHSQIGFKIRHIISKTRGHFDKYSGSIEFDEKKPASLKTTTTVQTASVNTSDAKRDEHLKSKDFFNVEQHPEMVFKSTKAKSLKDGKIELIGDLTLMGVTKPVTLIAEHTGTAKDPWGNTRIGFSAQGTLNRKDFGMGYNIPLDTGGFVIGDEVEILLEIEGIQKK